MIEDFKPPTTPVTQYHIQVQTSLDPELQAMEILQRAMDFAFGMLDSKADCHRVWDWIGRRARNAANEKGPSDVST